MAKLFIQAVKPFTELEVKVDGQDSILVGFKAYSLKDREQLAEKWTEFLELNKEQYEALVSTQDDASFEALEVEARVKVMQKALEFVAKQEEFNLANLVSDVLYLKNVTVTTYDEEQVISSFKVADTRKVEPLADFWETPEQAKQVLLDSFLDDKSWKEQLLAAHKDALESNYKAEQAKN